MRKIAENKTVAEAVKLSNADITTFGLCNLDQLKTYLKAFKPKETNVPSYKGTPAIIGMIISDIDIQMERLIEIEKIEGLNR